MTATFAPPVENCMMVPVEMWAGYSSPSQMLILTVILSMTLA